VEGEGGGGLAIFAHKSTQPQQIQTPLPAQDEPTNHLDASSVAWLEGFLSSYEGVVLAVTHDRYFLEKVAGWILEVQGGKTLPFHGNYSGWLRARATRYVAVDLI
jgi:sulfate-transporting ATPase